ncbi:MAG: MerR family transcriptional regulator [Firmicutes bacterium]|nr:MerR family transcriptional regulator [Bacillota bacterium]
MSEMLYTIKDVSDRTGISPHTLRFYDKEGLLPFLRKSPHGTRLFSEEDFESLFTITCLKKSGMSLHKIRDFMQLYAKGVETLPERQYMFEEHRKEILARMKELEEMLNIVNYKCWYFAEARLRNDPDFYKKLSAEEMPPQMIEFMSKVQNFKQAIDSGEPHDSV